MELEETIFYLREKFRKEHKIKSEDIVFFLSPGSCDKEIETNLEVSWSALEKFLIRNGFGQRKFENFHYVISVPDDYTPGLTFKFIKMGINIIFLKGNKNN